MFDLTKPADIGQTLLVTLIGMATVILGLTILIFLIKGLVKVTDGTTCVSCDVAGNCTDCTPSSATEAK